jgi:hypothetical protein
MTGYAMSSGKSKKSIKKEIDEKLIRLATIITDGWKKSRCRPR